MAALREQGTDLIAIGNVSKKISDLIRNPESFFFSDRNYDSIMTGH